MYKVTEESKKTVNQIVGNINGVSKAKGKKSYLDYGKSVVNLKMPATDSDAKDKIENFAEKQVKEIKASSKKVKANVTDVDY